MIIHHESKKRFLLLFFSIIAALKYAIIDQLSKWWIKSILITKPGYIISVTSFFDLVYSWNYGISFGIFSEYHAYSNKIFLVLNTCVILYIWKLLFESPNYKFFVGYSLIIGGAIGNLYDRMVNGAVFDFLYFHYNNFHFPVFNIADSFVSIGAAIIIFQHYKISKPVDIEPDEEYDALAKEADRIRALDEEIAKKGIK